MITSFYVLEHVFDPRAMMQCIHDLLARDDWPYTDTLHQAFFLRQVAAAPAHVCSHASQRFRPGAF